MGLPSVEVVSFHDAIETFLAKFHWFAQQYYSRLPESFADEVRSAWFTPPIGVADPEQIGRDYHVYLRLMQQADRSVGTRCCSTSITRPRWP